MIGLGVLDNVVVYSLLVKRRSPWNIILGSFSGGLPAVYGWTFATGSLGLVPILMAALVVLWTPNHIWSLALRYRDDYARAGVPMLPVVHGDEFTAWNILIYALSLVPLSMLLFVGGGLGLLYLVVAIRLGALRHDGVEALEVVARLHREELHQAHLLSHARSLPERGS